MTYTTPCPTRTCGAKIEFTYSDRAKMYDKKTMRPYTIAINPFPVESFCARCGLTYLLEDDKSVHPLMPELPVENDEW